MARAATIDGPYEVHPDVHVLTARHRPDLPLQRAGHADLVVTPGGATYMVYLCGRPLPTRGRCTLGRETAIQRMVWGDDGWLRTSDGRGLPSMETEAPSGGGSRSGRPGAAQFDGTALPAEFQWLRSPWPEELFSLTDRPAFSVFTDGKAWAARSNRRRRTPQQAHCYSASTLVEFEPRHFQQMAGLICY
jgi:xylan 1,4-beta-xylosidase